jgi:MOSC domain-containing protein YiiM
MSPDSDLPPGTILAVSQSPRRGIPKLPQAEVLLVADHGIEGDRHAGSRRRQVSLLEDEVLDDLRALGMPVAAGVLAENLLVRGLPFSRLAPGDRLRAGEEALLEVVEPRTPCKQLTPVDPRLPEAVVGRAGILCRVVLGGRVRPGDRLELESRG